MTTTWAYDGKPLYTFLKDKRPGDTTGDASRTSGTSRRRRRAAGARGDGDRGAPRPPYRTPDSSV
ncbi:MULTISPECIES: hypothetical protein [unclassified Streptomyces]|uniref:hypothetical protein n=1 Tax=unclassified Streptomyces TaxID=2593676 RepID=UPI0038132E24